MDAVHAEVHIHFPSNEVAVASSHNHNVPDTTHLPLRMSAAIGLLEDGIFVGSVSQPVLRTSVPSNAATNQALAEIECISSGHILHRTQHQFNCARPLPSPKLHPSWGIRSCALGAFTRRGQCFFEGFSCCSSDGWSAGLAFDLVLALFHLLRL